MNLNKICFIWLSPCVHLFWALINLALGVTQSKISDRDIFLMLESWRGTTARMKTSMKAGKG